MSSTLTITSFVSARSQFDGLWLTGDEGGGDVV